jgi:hypothetical protein
MIKRTLPIGFSALLAACSVQPVTDNPSQGAHPEPPAPPAPPVYSDPPNASGPRSVDYDVSEMAASISAQIEGDTLRVYAALLHQNVAGVDVHVRLVTGDYFTALVGPTELALLEEPDTGESPVDTKIYRYTASFPAPSGASSVVVAFQRPAGRSGAPLSQVSLPPDFRLVGAPARAAAGDVVSVTLDPPDANDALANVVVTANCIAGDHTVTLSVANAKPPPLRATLVDLPLAPGSTGCDGTLYVQRNSYGEVDSAFRRGAFDAIWTMDGSRQHEAAIHVGQ